jgi:hypothetical protein
MNNIGIEPWDNLNEWLKVMTPNSVGTLTGAEFSCEGSETL